MARNLTKAEKKLIDRVLEKYSQRIWAWAQRNKRRLLYTGHSEDQWVLDLEVLKDYLGIED